jgi:RNA polymerase sigma-70 factor, ECF subfamily
VLRVTRNSSMVADEEAAVEQALAAAYGNLRGGLLASIRRQVGDAQLAEDLLHDVFGKALRAIREGRAPGNLVAWLHHVVRTTIVDHYRARRLDIQPMEDEPAAQEPPDVAAFQSLATCLAPLAATLPPLYRNALHAADFQGQRLTALASDEGVTVSAIKSRVSRARGMLRERVLTCCAVSLDATGHVEDFQVRAAADCACAPTAAEANPRASRG